MNKNEAFALHMKSLLYDLVNNHTGLLRGIVERNIGKHTFSDEVHGDMLDFLIDEIEELQKKLRRIEGDVFRFVGGEPNYRELWKEDFYDGFKTSGYWWLMPDGYKFVETYKFQELQEDDIFVTYSSDTIYTVILPEDHNGNNVRFRDKETGKFYYSIMRPNEYVLKIEKI